MVGFSLVLVFVFDFQSPGLVRRCSC